MEVMLCMHMNRGSSAFRLHTTKGCLCQHSSVTAKQHNSSHVRTYVLAGNGCRIASRAIYVNSLNHGKLVKLIAITWQCKFDKPMLQLMYYNREEVFMHTFASMDAMSSTCDKPTS